MRKYYDMMDSGSSGSYKDIDGDWKEPDKSDEAIKILGVIIKRKDIELAEAKAEIGRLKRMIKKSHYSGWYNGLINAYTYQFSWNSFLKRNKEIQDEEK